MNKFLNEACDTKYLSTEVALIMGIMGACRANEMYLMKTKDVRDLGVAFLVSLPKTKTKVSRKFMDTDMFYLICKKYIQKHFMVPHSNIFFFKYNRKCTSQKIGQ